MSVALQHKAPSRPSPHAPEQADAAWRRAEAGSARETEARREAEAMGAREAEARREAEAEVERLRREIDRLKQSGQ